MPTITHHCHPLPTGQKSVNTTLLNYNWRCWIVYMCVNKEEYSRLWDRIWQLLKAYNVPSTVLGVAGLIGIHTLYRDLKSLIRFTANITSGRTTILIRQYDLKVYTLHHYTIHSTLRSNPAPTTERGLGASLSTAYNLCPPKRWTCGHRLYSQYLVNGEWGGTGASGEILFKFWRYVKWDII